MPFIIVGIILLVVLILAPSWWVRRVLTQNQLERVDLQGTGADIARYLLDRAGLAQITVELTDHGDHYDPGEGVIRLSIEHYDGRSIAALAVATHEVSHALQHANGDRMFALRQKLAPSVIWFERIAQVVFFLIPLLGIVVRSPAMAMAQVIFVVALLGCRLAMHIVTLPVELDASFGRALPILQAGKFIPDADMPAARQVLRAAAMTYVAAALISLIDITRLIRILR
jgi:uncharacterized protein